MKPDPVEPMEGKVHVLVLDEKDRLLRWVSPDYANRALDREEVVRTDRLGVVRVAKRPDVDFYPLDGAGKPTRPDSRPEPTRRKAKR